MWRTMIRNGSIISEDRWTIKQKVKETKEDKDAHSMIKLIEGAYVFI